MERENQLSHEGFGSVLHETHAGITVFDRKRENAGLVGRAHARPLALRHGTRHDQTFGASADAAGKRTHPAQAGCKGRQDLGNDGAAVLPDIPECGCHRFLCRLRRGVRTFL
ncbi:hypothetical protein SL003B_3929 [Polymorphum gilvum SL003B-26A1]|uniref:Uncharacterized protein n=1 Tax=Polymorphum gilvum (strain LMG 25793 / CGMCC 1.9160 / SL003B-26A1) TaxID=991905 RepID=F2J5H9_POLGS|nr:hypothetical protein SL003B_3929 [Polymorphum gilvum SL003B-26A1]